MDLVKNLLRKKSIRLGIAAIITAMLFFIFVPSLRFNEKYSTVLEDSNGYLLQATVADDGQWRFPQIDSLSEKYETCLLLFEDRYYYYHPGINPLSVFRALQQNIKHQRVKSGGSTITMQLARISRNNPPRTITEKILEAMIAVKAECMYSKRTILQMYASHAPFGGNVIGIEAAAWRYYGVNPSHLSWAEAATLAVLPNSPSLIYPGKNHFKLTEKRNRLLKKLFITGKINEDTYRLALAERVPDKIQELPSSAPHLLTTVINENRKGERIITSIDKQLQEKVSRTLLKYYQQLRFNDIKNAAAIIIDVKTGKVLAYVGNITAPEATESANVDITRARRSYGSTMKPILYAAMVQEGSLLPEQLVEDIPAVYNGFMPQNFFNEFDGVVPADEVLSRSLNVPSVNLLKQYGIEKYNSLVKTLGITTIDQPAAHYGLSVILGGAEANLWELTGLYASMAQHLKYGRKDFSISYEQDKKDTAYASTYHTGVFSDITLWHTLNAITTNKRPVTQTNWEYFHSSQKIAWKTGTSFGFRDAWAIGVTPKYAVGVWVGNASGEGRPGLTGVSVAAPVMFDLFSMLPSSAWFKEPVEKGNALLAVCSKSGYKAGKFCTKRKLLSIPSAATRGSVCPYHKQIHLDSTRKWMVSSNCYPVAQMQTANWFVLSLAVEHYYKLRHSDYIPLPAVMPGCENKNLNKRNLQFIYPKQFTRIYIPKGGIHTGKAIFEVASASPAKTLYWHLDNEYLGETKDFHKKEIVAPPGYHTVTVINEDGESVSQKFEVISD